MSAEYWTARDKAEAKAKELSGQCAKLFVGEPLRRIVEGKAFCAVGGHDKDGSFHFAVDWATPEDRADVSAFLSRPIC